MSAFYNEYEEDFFYNGPERRHANEARRKNRSRRYRCRDETEVSDCRQEKFRRKEDEEGFIEISGLYPEE